MFHSKTSKFYFNILFKNIKILFHYFVYKHQNFISMFRLKTSKFYFNILLKNIKILFHYFVYKHQNFISIFRLKTSKFYFNILLKNIKILFHYYHLVHWINIFAFVEKRSGWVTGQSLSPWDEFYLEDFLFSRCSNFSPTIPNYLKLITILIRSNILK